VYLPSKGAQPVAVLRALLPAAYPSAVGPVLELDAAHLPQQQLEAAVQEMEAMFCPGEEPAHAAAAAGGAVVATTAAAVSLRQQCRIKLINCRCLPWGELPCAAAASVG
jgi:hypothetical protein